MEVERNDLCHDSQWSEQVTGDRLLSILADLVTVGLTVIVRTPGRRLMSIGQEGNSWLLRLFGFPNAQIHIF